MEKLRERGLKLRHAQENEKDMFFARTKEDYEKDACVGYLRLDFGTSGTQFWHTWFPENGNMLNTERFKNEFDQLINELRDNGPLHSRSEMRDFVRKNGGILPTAFGEQYGYVIDTQNYVFYARFNPMCGDYNGYIYAYEKHKSFEPDVEIELN